MFNDTSGIPNQGTNDVQIFNTSSGGQWKVWNRPRGYSMAFMTCVGSGAGGGGGHTAATGTVRGGGAGGGSGAVARLLIPIYALPNRLYILVGAGGAGGTASNPGGAGARSYITVSPSVGTATLTVLQSGNVAAGGGAAGSVAGNATGGLAETISTDALCILGTTFGINKFVAGGAGTNGGVVGGAAGSAFVYTATSFSTPGAGGGTTPAANTDFAGGAITGTGLLQNIAGGAAGLPGSAFRSTTPFLHVGGTGGGTGGAGAAGAGGSAGGSSGAGGGGGGGGITGGVGGSGGDGYVSIICW